MKVLYHLGLGDAIACAAIIAKLAKENDVVEIPCWEHNLVSVKSFYVNHPNVSIKCFDAKKASNDVLGWGQDADLFLGFYNRLHDQRENEDFVQWFYRQAGMTLEDKAKHCPINKAVNTYIYQAATIYPRHIVIHQDAERGFKIKLEKNKEHVVDIKPYILGNSGQLSILYYSELLQNAKEIHCIDSSVLHLVECLPTNAKIFYHKYARPNSPDYKYLQKKWEVIE